MILFDFTEFELLVADGCDHYELTAPTVTEYLDDLYRRVCKNQPVQLREVVAITRLKDDGVWLQPNYAANMIYHLMHEVGLDTTGQTGF